MNQVNSILLIDDDNIFNFLNKTIILKGNFARNVNSFCHTQKALDYLWELWDSGNEKFPEIIFLDINMRDMDGWEFLKKFEAFPESALEDCHVFMLTSSIDKNDIEISKSFRTVMDFISKPLSTEILKKLPEINFISEKSFKVL